MRFGILLTLAIVVVATSTRAQDGPVTLADGNSAKLWQAVGRLDINGTGFCTGALIAPKLVLTAAHCLFDKVTNKRLDGADIEFLAGWRNGRAGAYRNVSRAVLHPDYIYDSEPNSDRVRNDLALLELTQPINNTTIQPFRTATGPVAGDHVGVVSYAQNRSEAPSFQEVCKVLSLQEGVLVTTCDVDFGASGAPIFTFDGDQARIVSVVSAKAELDGEAVALGTALSQPLAQLQASLIAGEGVALGAATRSVRIRAGEHSRNTGAKFVKP